MTLNECICPFCKNRVAAVYRNEQWFVSSHVTKLWGLGRKECPGSGRPAFQVETLKLNISKKHFS